MATQSRAISHAAAVAAMAVAFAGALIGLQHLGQTSRTFDPAVTLRDGPYPIRVVGSSGDLYRLWEETGLKGRQLVHLSRFLHFVPIAASNATTGLDRFPVRTFDLPAYYETRLDATNLLWISMQTGIVRGVHHVLPSHDLDTRLAQLNPEMPGVRIDGRRIVTFESGSPRTLFDQLPEIEEPVLVSIDASFLEAVEPEAVVELLRTSRLRSDLIALCRAEANPDVSTAARQRLDQLAKALQRGVP